MSTERSPTSTSAAFKWSILGEGASRLIAPAVFLILARILTPEDFGVVAAATVVISLCQALADLGLGKALIQRRSHVDKNANAAFWISLASSSVLGTILFAGAPYLASFFDDPRVTSISRVLAILVPLTGLAAVPTALLQRQLAFKKLFWVRLIATGLPALASVPLALSGWGYWSLVAGTLVGQTLQCICLWMQCPWRPARTIDADAARKLVTFGRWSALSAALAWSYSWLDSLIVARYLGLHEMGLYRIGNTFVTMVFGLAFSPLLPVLYSLFSRSSHEAGRIGEALLTASRVIVLVSIPTATLIILLSHSIETRLFGNEWAGLAPIVALLATGQGLAWLVGAHGEAYRAIGRPETEFITIGLSLTVYVIGYVISIHYGLLAFVATRALMVIFGIAIHLWMTKRLFYINKIKSLKPLIKPIVFSFFAALISIPTSSLFSGVGSDIALFCVFSSFYMIFAFLYDSNNVNKILERINGS